MDANEDGCLDRLEDLDDVIRELELSRRTERVLLRNVKHAQRAYVRGDLESAKGNLRALLSKIGATRGERIPREEAQMLMRFVKNVLTQLRREHGAS